MVRVWHSDFNLAKSLDLSHGDLKTVSSFYIFRDHFYFKVAVDDLVRTKHVVFIVYSAVVLHPKHFTG